MDLISVAVGGVIGIAGAIMAAHYTSILSAEDGYRRELAAAYAEWSGKLLEALDGWTSLERFDQMHSGLEDGRLGEAPSDAAGQPREALVKRMLDSWRELEISTTKLMMLEPLDSYSNQVRTIANIRAKDSDKIGYAVFADAKHKQMHNLLKDLCHNHPLLARGKNERGFLTNRLSWRRPLKEFL